jgi:hypothetical protein
MIWAFGCLSFSKVARTRTTWCGVLLFSSSSTFLKIFPGSPVMLWHSSSLLLLSFSKIFRVRPMFWTLSLSLSGNIENSRPPSPWCGALVRFSFVIFEKKSGPLACSVLSSPLAIHPRKPDMPGLDVLCSLPFFIYIAFSKTRHARFTCSVLSSLSQKRQRSETYVCAFRAARMRSQSTVDDYMFGLCGKLENGGPMSRPALASK